MNLYFSPFLVSFSHNGCPRRGRSCCCGMYQLPFLFRLLATLPKFSLIFSLFIKDGDGPRNVVENPLRSADGYIPIHSAGTDAWVSLSLSHLLNLSSPNPPYSFLESRFTYLSCSCSGDKCTMRSNHSFPPSNRPPKTIRVIDDELSWDGK